ncbi:MAG: PHP domain-containing protein, partial [Treponema sp.]|nr:PHP domain-containing protein [Treponema sp.]
MDTRLGLCSAYSLLCGTRKPEELLNRAAACNVKTVSVCDINNLYGVHSFLEAAKEKGIRPVIGAALTVRRHDERVYCFAENRAGFGRLCEILTERSREKGPFDPLPLLKENSAGLALASACGGPLRELAGKVKRLYAAITADSLGGLGPHRELALPLAFLDTSLFLDESDRSVHRALRAIGLNKTIGSLAPEDTAPPGSGLFRPSPELLGRLESWPEAEKGTAEIAGLCRFNELFDGFIFPAYGENPQAELRRRTYGGAALRYGELGDMEIDRIEYELGIIDKMGFSPYFLRMDDIVKMAKEAGNSPYPEGAGRTCGRGSGAASVVSYSLGITNVDPIAYNLYFERFLNPARPDPPDIDVDFAWDERDALITSVIEKFGPDCCARVANHNFFRLRSALRETAKAYGFSDGVISRHERKIIDFREKDEKPDPLWAEIYLIASRIDGLPRGLGMHCGGLVITPGPVWKFAPVEKSAKSAVQGSGQAAGQGFPLLSWEKEGAEAAGFVKIDLLGNRSLAVIRDALAGLEERGITFDPNTWRPCGDSATVQALARGDSMGVFYIESPAMRQLQVKTGAGDFEHIVIHSSIIRPAANKFISEYVRRLKGGSWEPLHPRLEYILDESYGILCYQEDVSKAAVALAGFNEADADRLRKVIAKKAGAAKLAVYHDQFFEGCRRNGVDERTVRMIWSMMLSFDGYSFCKPHSASYAMVSFQSAYLRVHHPAEFMAAVLSNQGGFYRPGAYISECRRMGLFTLGPDINLSRWKYRGAGRDVIIGLMAVKGLSLSGAERIVAERERAGDFKSLDDFSRRVKPCRDDITALCPAGVFDSIAGALPRPLQARRLLSAGSAGAGPGQEDLFASEALPVYRFAGKTSVNRHSDAELWEEYRALGF